MPKLRRLSGTEVAGVFRGFGFVVVSQRGSHMKLQRVAGDAKQTLTIPTHAGLDPGTLRAIIRQASRFVREDDLRPYFYS